MQISSKFCHKSHVSPVFRRPKMRPFQQCMTVTAVNLFYEVLPKQFEAFGFYFSQKNLDLRQILPPKMPFFVRQECKCRQKFCHKSWISSKITIVVTTASFRHFVSFPSKTKEPRLMMTCFVWNKIRLQACVISHFKLFSSLKSNRILIVKKLIDEFFKD